jgi:N-terminal domain of ribose phosphate pyrophosphokinase
MAVAVAMAASGILGGATTIALCEHRWEHSATNVRDPRTFYSAEDEQDNDEIQKDPMTSYAVHAARMEMLEEQKAQMMMQATSPSEPTPAEMPSFSATPSIMTAEEERIEEATRKAKQHSGGLKIFSGNGNIPLALEITRHLGINLGKATVGRFADGEVNVQINENVRGKDVYIIQPTCPPVNDNMMELLLMVSTLRRASARRITAVIPYYGYARQDRKMQVGRFLL